MASKNSNDLNVTIKEGKSLITALIEALNENTEALKRAAGGSDKPEAKCEEATQTEQSDALAPELPATPAPPVQQTAPNPLPQPTVVPPQAQTPVAPPQQTPQAVPTPQGYPQQPQTGAPVNYAPQQSTPAQTPYMPGVPNTTPQQATPNYPVSAAGPAPGTNMTGAVPTTATTPGVSAVNPPSAPTAGITLDMISNAGAELVEKGYMAQVLDILHRHGVDSANALKPEHYAEVAQELRALGATNI